jgi:hypothetical protein
VRVTNAGRVRLIAGVVVSIGTGVASASVFVPAPAAEHLVGSEALQPDGSLAVVGARARDPGGGRAWAVRTYRSRTGQTCPEPGRLSAARFGTIDDRGDFAALPVRAAGTCGDLAHGGLAAFAVNRYAARPGEGARIAIFGVAAPPVRSVTLVTPTSTRSLDLVAGSFLAVGAQHEFAGAVLQLTTVDDRTTFYDLRAATG